VERYFGTWHRSGARPSFDYPEVKARTGKSVTVTSPSATQTQVTMAQVIDVHRGDPAYIPLELADTVLSGEGPGSILFRDLREKNGYVYDVSSDMNIGQTSSSFSVDFAADPKNVERASAAVVADLARLQTTLIPVEDLQRAKALLLAQRVLPLDSYQGIASNILDAAESGTTRSDDDAFWAQLLQTTPEQVRAAMRKYVQPSKFTRVIVAPSSS
jgi:zinc protease